MRCGIVLALCACGGAATGTSTPKPPADARLKTTDPVVDTDKAPIDPIAVLAPVDDQPVSWLSPGSIQLDLGGGGIESPGGNRPIEVVIADRQGTMVRAVVRLPHARFSLWSDRARLFGVLVRSERITTFPSQMPMDEMFVELHAGARVRRLGHRGKQTQVRFVGALQVEGWVPDDALADAGEGGDRGGRIPTGRRQVMVMSGSIIRAKPEWGMNELALVAGGYLLDSVHEDLNGWIEVTYADGEVSVHGYTSKMQPPGRVHRLQDPDVPPPVITPNARVASGTCLYSKRNGDTIGYIVGDATGADRDVQLDDLGNGWWTLAVDTPWGPIPFAAKGPSQTSMTACAPAGSVPTAP